MWIFKGIAQRSSMSTARVLRKGDPITTINDTLNVVQSYPLRADCPVCDLLSPKILSAKLLSWAETLRLQSSIRALSGRLGSGRAVGMQRTARSLTIYGAFKYTTPILTRAPYLVKPLLHFSFREAQTILSQSLNYHCLESRRSSL